MEKGEERVGVREEVEEGRREVKGDGDEGREGGLGVYGIGVVFISPGVYVDFYVGKCCPGLLPCYMV